MVQRLTPFAWPSYSTSSYSLEVTTYRRINEGVGAYSAYAEVPTLIVVYPTGRSEAVSSDVIYDYVEQYLFDTLSGLGWWNPKKGDMRSNIRAALPGSRPLGSTTWPIRVYIDGQFGSIVVG